MIDAASIGSLVWMWLAVGLCGVLAWPLASLLLPSDSDRGYLAAKPLGWLIGAYVAWLASALGILSFASFGPAAGLGALLVIFILTVRRLKPLPPLARILQWEAAFLLVLLAGSLLKGATPDIAGLEKFMDFGFVNAALRASAMPPPDPWWAGEPINYYYFGHAAAAWLIDISGVPSDRGYNLMIAVLFAFAATLAYRIVAGSLPASSPRIAAACGLVAGTLVTIGGNFHSVLYGPLRAFSPTTYDRDFYYPDSTRFIGFDPSTGDKAFTEMPPYGFAVGDLHAHLLNVPAAFLLLLILLRLVQRAASASAQGMRLIDASVLGLLFAVAAMSNSWDAVSYGVLLVAASLTAWLYLGRSLTGLLRWAGWCLFIVVLALLLAAPFLVTFRPFASELRWSDAHTPLWQLAVLYAHIAGPCFLLLAGLVSPARRNPSWVAAAMLATVAVILLALPEIAYVKDIYGEDHRRANTMFKFAFQAQPIAVMAGMMAIGLLLGMRRALAGAGALVLAVPLLATLSYAGDIYGGLLRNISSHRFTLDGLGFIDRTRPDDRALIDWLRHRPLGEHLLLMEAYGDSYGDSGRLSALTGVPALLGWRGHEWLWRGDPAAVYGRADEISSFYSAADLDQACRMVNKYGVTHVAIGTIERQSFATLNENVLRGLGPIVAERGSSLLIVVENCLKK